MAAEVLVCCAFGYINIDLSDLGEDNGTDDGKVRVSEILPRLTTKPWQLFDVSGEINAFLGAEIEVFGETVYEVRLATYIPSWS